jgi:long-chain fatty acid transport protein
VEILPRMLTFGAAFRSGVDLSYSNGRAHFSNVPVEFANTLKDQAGTTDIQLPESLNLGLALKPFEALTVEADVNYTAWQRNDAIVLTFSDPQLSKYEPKHWHYSWNYHLGGEYQLNQQLTLRAGLLYDPTPSPAETLGPDLPDATRLNIALGGGYRFSDFRVDLGYQLIIFMPNKSTNPVLPGEYKGIVNLLALTLAYGK